jgi:hypothetical protein
MLFVDFRGARSAALMKPVDTFRMLFAGTVISVLASSSSSSNDDGQAALQTRLVFGIQSLQFVLEVMYRPEVDPHETILSVLAMATELVPLGMCLLPADSLDCGKLSLEMQLVVLGVALLSIVQRILGLLWEMVPQIWVLGHLVAKTFFCAKETAKKVSMQRKKAHSAHVQKNQKNPGQSDSGYRSVMVELGGSDEAIWLKNLDNAKWGRLAAAQPLTWKEVPNQLTDVVHGRPAAEYVTDEELVESIVRSHDIIPGRAPAEEEQVSAPLAAAPVLHIDVADPM